MQEFLPTLKTKAIAVLGNVYDRPTYLLQETGTASFLLGNDGFSYLKLARLMLLGHALFRSL